jgi:hypothetical protein
MQESTRKQMQSADIRSPKRDADDDVRKNVRSNGECWFAKRIFRFASLQELNGYGAAAPYDVAVTNPPRRMQGNNIGRRIEEYDACVKLKRSLQKQTKQKCREAELMMQATRV